ncbi:MAG: cell division protein ZapA [Alphaproteobacteria bacterium]|jgi:cell division protein ZapA|nr:cell division protein ZapA [Alphaproteobacteria bacterium]
MSQSTVTVRINGQPYQMGCDVGQESHIEEMGRNVDAIVQQLVGSVGQIGDARLLAMAGLILADQVQSANQQAGVASRQSSGGEPVTAQEENTVTLTTEQMDNLVNQITIMAQTIEHLAQSQE